MKELLNNLSPIFKNQKELSDHLEALIKINNPANLNALDLIIFQEMIEIIKKQ
jgi:enoyl-CoA hydratase/carnithine racemase